MKGYLLDENLPRVATLRTSFPVVHALDLGQRLTDSEIWVHARTHDLVIVSKDADFSQRMVLAEPPPRVIHLRVGNVRRRDFVEWLERVWPRVEASVATHKLVNVHRGGIEAIR